MSEDTFYIYQHIPKCAGQAFRRACQNWFHLLLEKPPKKTDAAAWAAFLAEPVDFSTIPGDTMICGHLIHDGIRPWERYEAEIAAGNVRTLTIFRDPLERALSVYFFRQRQGKPTEPTIEAHLATVRNPMAHQSGCKDGDPREFLRRYFFVGVTEYLQTSVDLLAHLAGQEKTEVPVNNVTPRKPYEIAPAALESFRKENSADYALHAAAVDLLRDRCRTELGCELPAPQMRVTPVA